MPVGPNFPFVRSVLHVEQVDSTSDLAKRLVLETTLELPALIWADRQTRGRGQRSSTWWSDAGSLTATVALDPTTLGLTAEQEPRVALASAVVIVEAIAGLYPGCRAGIRWPNDVEVGGLKLGGILPERVETPSGPRLLIGIGLNVQTRLADAPPEVARMAATLADWEEPHPSADPKSELLAAILGGLPAVLRSLAENHLDLARRWARLDTLAGSIVRVEAGPEPIAAVADGIDERGGLRLRTEGGVRVIHAGRILREG
jgi:BirA family biotin operon repressor/biotin-[acetyl-CoA-carboxylase] ligase